MHAQSGASILYLSIYLRLVFLVRVPWVVSHVCVGGCGCAFARERDLFPPHTCHRVCFSTEGLVGNKKEGEEEEGEGRMGLCPPSLEIVHTWDCDLRHTKRRRRAGARVRRDVRIGKRGREEREKKREKVKCTEKERRKA